MIGQMHPLNNLIFGFHFCVRFRYVISFILQFQIHKGACTAAGQYKPNDTRHMLSDCDIYESEAAGNKLK